jgi:hypothetical protein
MPRRICIFLLVVASTASPAFCQQAGNPSAGAATPAATSSRPSERRLDDSAVAEAKLKKIIPGTLEFDENPLDVSMNLISESMKHPIALDVQALHEITDTENTYVSGQFTNTSYEHALNLLLKQIDPQLTYTLRHGVILITSEERAHEELCIRIYDVQDLVTFIDKKGKPYSDPEDLITAIISNFEPDTWDDLGGEGRITPLEGTGVDVLVVSHIPQMHAQIAQFLTALRELRHNEEYQQGPRYRPRRPIDPPVPPAAGENAEGSGLTEISESTSWSGVGGAE